MLAEQRNLADQIVSCLHYSLPARPQFLSQIMTALRAPCTVSFYLLAALLLVTAAHALPTEELSLSVRSSGEMAEHFHQNGLEKRADVGLISMVLTTLGAITYASLFTWSQQ